MSETTQSIGKIAKELNVDYYKLKRVVLALNLGTPNRNKTIKLSQSEIAKAIKGLEGYEKIEKIPVEMEFKTRSIEINGKTMTVYGTQQVAVMLKTYTKRVVNLARKTGNFIERDGKILMTKEHIKELKKHLSVSKGPTETIKI